MSIVAISETAGSLGIEIGRNVAESLGWDFADREILAKAADRFGEDVTALRHSVEEKPTLWERFSETQHRYKAYVEAIMLEMAAGDNVVLAGRSSTLVLRQVPHVVRVRTRPSTCGPSASSSSRGSPTRRPSSTSGTAIGSGRLA